jgi:hypothetical protein
MKKVAFDTCEQIDAPWSNLCHKNMLNGIVPIMEQLCEQSAASLSNNVSKVTLNGANLRERSFHSANL